MTTAIGSMLPLLLACQACAAPRPAFRAAAIEHGKLHPVDGFWVLELDGTAAERGRAAGLLVGEQVRWLLPRQLKKIAGVDRLSPAHKERVAALASDIPRPYVEQVNAYAEAAGVDRTALFAVNLAPEVWTAFACSCLATTAERSADGKVRLARNLDWHGGEILADAGLVVVESGGSHRFASFSWPGLVGVATGMNDAGVAVADLMALQTGAKRPQPGVPVLFAVRSLLENADSIEAATDRLRAMPRTIPQNYALADRDGVRAVETSATHFQVRPVEAGLGAITNFWNEARGGAKDGRYDGMLKAAGDGKLGVSELERILAGSAIKQMNVQSVILEPETRKAYSAQGKMPVASGVWRTLDLGPWLRRD